MNLSLQIKGTILAAISSVAGLALGFAGSKVFQSAPTTASASAPASGDNGALVIPPAGRLANQGYKLFLLNCAHCHGTDARGDEGPDLHGLTKSEARIGTLIKNGKKGEMPKFASKLSDSQVHALV